MRAKQAVLVSEQEPYGVALLRAEYAAKKVGSRARRSAPSSCSMEGWDAMPRIGCRLQEAFDASRAIVVCTAAQDELGFACEQQVAVYGNM